MSAQPASTVPLSVIERIDRMYKPALPMTASETQHRQLEALVMRLRAAYHARQWAHFDDLWLQIKSLCQGAR